MAARGVSELSRADSGASEGGLSRAPRRAARTSAMFFMPGLTSSGEGPLDSPRWGIVEVSFYNPGRYPGSQPAQRQLRGDTDHALPRSTQGGRARRADAGANRSSGRPRDPDPLRS